MTNNINSVCGMTVALPSEHHHQHDGKEHDFCSIGCLQKFRSSPEQYLSPARQQGDDCLNKLVVPGTSVFKVKGFGEHLDFFKPDWLCQHVRVEVFIDVGRTEKVATAIMDAAHTGREGGGIVAVLSVESVYHIRTKEKCHYEVCK